MSAHRWRPALLLYGVAVAAYVLDRLTKLWAERHLQGRPPLVLVPHVVSLDYTTNTGGAFSLLTSQPWLFVGASVLVCLVVVALSPRIRSTATALGLGLVLGGGLGNLTDRLFHGQGISGRVVDFIDFHVWPVFNLADSSIVVGIIVVVAAQVFRGAPPEDSGDSGAGSPAEPAEPGRADR